MQNTRLKLLKPTKWYHGTIDNFIRNYGFLLRVHENSLRGLVGLAQLPGLSMEVDGRPSDIAACAQYLKSKIKAYEKQPWSKYAYYPHLNIFGPLRGSALRQIRTEI